MPAACTDRQRLDSASTLFLDHLEEMRMELSNEQLIAEAIEINHAGVDKEKTLERYRDHLAHYDLVFPRLDGHLKACVSKPRKDGVSHAENQTDISR